MKFHVTYPDSTVEPQWYEKGWGRIFVSHESHKERMIELMKELDEFEFGYLPDNMFAVNPNNGSDWDDTKLIYYGKFNFDSLPDEYFNILAQECIDYHSESCYEEVTSLEDFYGPGTTFNWKED